MSEDFGRVRKTLLFVLALNLLVAGAKAFFGLLAGSVSMVADAFHSVFDSFSNITGLVAVRLADRPPDRIHPYGYGKYETLGTLVVGSLLLITAMGVMGEGAMRLFSPSMPDITALTVGVMVATIIINISVSWYERRVGEEINSDFLIADSKHTKSDVYVSFSVLLGFAFVLAGFPAADPLIAFVIAVLIGRMGFSILKRAGAVLTDSPVVDCEGDVARAVAETKGVLGYHDFRCRGRENEMFADIHIEVDPAITVAEGHRIAEEARQNILTRVEGLTDVVVHMDPAGEKEK